MKIAAIGPPGGPAVPSHHSAMFRVEPEAAIVTGASAMTIALLDLLTPDSAATSAATP